MLSDEQGRNPRGIEQREANSAPVQHDLQFAELTPLKMAAELAINIVDPSGGLREERVRAAGSKHIHEHKVLAADQLDASREALRQQRIVERSEKNEQRPFAKPQPDESAQLVEIRRHRLRLQRVEAIAASVVVRLPALRADEAEHAVAESQQAELIALLLRREAEDQCSGDKALQDQSFQVSRSGFRLIRTASTRDVRSAQNLKPET